MARGWGSKDVESQQDALDGDRPAGPRLNEAQVAAARRRESLQLSRTRLLHQMSESSNQRYLEILRRSLAEIEAQLAAVPPA